LQNRRVEQRFVLAGVTVSSFLVLLQSSNAVRFGPTGYSEGSWYLAWLLQIACLIGAYWTVRQHEVESLPAAPRQRVPLMVIALTCGALSIAATYDEWTHISDLIGTVVPDRSPLVVWLVLLALVPTGVIVALAARGSYSAHVSLATIATLAAVNYAWNAKIVDGVFHLNASRWLWTAASYLVLAGVAWWAVIARARSKPSAI
jgi:hypothetical protein